MQDVNQEGFRVRFNITPRVVLIDDIDEVTATVKRGLVEKGYELHFFDRTKDFLDGIDSIQPHLILLNIQNESDGALEYVKKIRRRKFFKDIPIVYITVLDHEEDLKSALECGVTEILSKPIRVYQLQFRVDSMLNQYFLRHELALQNEALAQEAEDKESLLRIMCHDLLNPVTVMKFYSKKLDNEQVRIASEQTLGIINHVRSMLALESGKKDFPMEKVDLKDCLARATACMDLHLKDKDVTIESNFDNMNDEMVVADKNTLVSQVLNNLISNAIKFSFPGSSIGVNYRIENDLMKVEISDKGVGVEKEFVPHLFNKYKKTSTPGTQDEKGTGFGLPIVKTYMNLYGGQVEVESKSKVDGHMNDHGTTFTLTFQIAE
jgi:two-component system, sensor histidine kinase and response regulator